MAAKKKAFKIAKKARSSRVESTPKDRQFKITGGSNKPLKKIVGYKLPDTLHQEVAHQAIKLTPAFERKVWPAHVVEAALKAFLELSQSKQLTLLEKVE